MEGDCVDNFDSSSVISMNKIFPDDLVERILSYLPIDSLIRAGCVCKRWQELVTTKRFLQNSAHSLSQKPWYFMFTSSADASGYAYDPILRMWHDIHLPCIQSSNWSIASSCGLVCFMDKNMSDVYVCNPITRCCKRLDQPPGPQLPDYTALAVSVARPITRSSQSYKVSIVKSKQVPEDFLNWDISIHVYDSETKAWATAITEVITGWRAGEESVICDGVLYFLIYSMGGCGLVIYDLGSHAPNGSLMGSFVSMPCYLTCGRLMSLRGKLVMVGGIGKNNRSSIIKGIGIWVLKGREWLEIARMPPKYFRGFGEIDEVFSSCGTGDLIYIHSYEVPTLLVFDIDQKSWRWSQKFPVMKRFPFQLFTGFCFDPRLEIEP